MRTPCAGLLLAIVLTAAALPRPAAAYVRYYTERHAPFFWAVPTIPITVYVRDFNQQTMTSRSGAGRRHRGGRRLERRPERLHLRDDPALDVE